MLLGHCFINFHNEGAQFFEGKREVIDVNNGSVAGKDSIANNCSELEISGVGCDNSGVAVLPLKATVFLIIFFFFLGLYIESVVSGKGFSLYLLQISAGVPSCLEAYKLVSRHTDMVLSFWCPEPAIFFSADC